MQLNEHVGLVKHNQSAPSLTCRRHSCCAFYTAQCCIIHLKYK